jgi:hypothetical protein
MLAKSEQFLESELAELEITANNFAIRFIPDAKMRKEYIESTRKFSLELQDMVKRNKLSPNAAAVQANIMRNNMMEAMRGKSSDFGLAIARFLKKEGLSLTELEQKYGNKLFNSEFDKLSLNQKNVVWRKIVAKAGEPRVRASNGAMWLGRAGKGLFFLTVAIAVYHIATFENKVRETANECIAMGGGMAGSAVLGYAGLLCGPGAIVCVPLGVFVGGIIGSAGADWAFDSIWE